MTDPTAFAATYEEGRRLHREGRWADAAAAYRRAAQQGLTVNLAGDLGACLAELGEFAEAERWLQLAVGRRPDDAELRRRLGLVYAAQDRTDAAEAELRAGLDLAPEAETVRLALGALLLSLGRYQAGWPLLEARVRVNPRAAPPLGDGWTEWQGEPLAGCSILIQVEQGLGDQIQMIRFARALKAQGAAHVTAACRSQLAALFASAPGVDEAVALDAGRTVSLRRRDLWTRYFSLPGRLGVTEADLWDGPYLAADAERRTRWRPSARVGLAWKASPTGQNARNKSLPPDLAQAILARGAMSLQPEDTGVADMADTAAIIAGLDLVISIDTSVAHLAGAMGKPCWTLLPRVNTDWRWLRARVDSPWYPSMRLYRQAEAGDWRAVVAQVLGDLDATLG